MCGEPRGAWERAGQRDRERGAGGLHALASNHFIFTLGLGVRAGLTENANFWPPLQTH